MKTITIGVKPVDNTDRIRKYLNVTYKFHKLTDKEIEILLAFVEEYQELQKVISDKDYLNTILFNSTTKSKISQKISVQKAVLDNYLTTFRKKGVIKNNQLVPNFVPPSEPFDVVIKML